jgi:bifunctional non-homologous end joining protein LigD
VALRFPVSPMKATLGTLPASDDGWAYEIKWDGHRTLAHIDGSSVRLQTTSGKISSERWPEVLDIAGAVNADTAILDGEMLVIGDDGLPSFDLVQARDASRHPAMFQAFDVLSINGTDTVDLPYTSRRDLLMQLVEPGDHWAVPAHHLTGGKALLDATAEQGLEGLIAKRVDSVYRPGARSKDWLKLKNRVRVEVVIGGFTAGTGNRSSTFGALLVGVVEPDVASGADGRLRFAGGVGTGFTHDVLESLRSRLAALETEQCPFDPVPPRPIARTATWVAPELRAIVDIAEFTNDGHVRHASFVGLVDD